MRWPVPTLAAIDTAAAAARAGTPTALAIEGEAGFGKSTLLREVASRLDGFHLLRAFGEESAQDDRFQLLQEWNAVPDEGAVPRHILQAARLLGQVVDRCQLTGPVALVLDDLQWIDTESVDAVAALVQRAAGDRLLVLAAHRPLGGRHPAWRRITEHTFRLEGLDGEATAELVAALDPDAPNGLVEELRAHTGGSPLYMRALLQEHSSRELAALAARGELPAPADLAAAVDARVAGLAPDAARLLHALAVLGDAWIDVPTVMAVGGVDDVDVALAVLRDEGLVRWDAAAAVPRIRIVHAVVRAAVYDTVPGPARRQLHRAAAARLPDAGRRMRHRLAATVGADEGLAGDLDRHADELHARGQFREAARFRRLAASITSSDVARERRLYDADIDAILAHDLDGVATAEPDAQSGAHQRLVHAMRLAAAKRWVAAARVLDPVGPADIARLDPVNAYRARVLRGWTIFAAGRPAADALAPLQQAAASPVHDEALRGMFTFAYGQAMQATTDPNAPLWGFDEAMDVDRATLAASGQGLVRLSWRGSAYALTGMTAKAIGDLSLITARIDDGTFDLGDGVFHALLGFAQWMNGEWRRASISIGLALATPLAPHPTAVAMSPLVAVVTGEDAQAGSARSRAARLSGPIPSAINAGDVADIAALAFTGSPGGRRGWLARRVEDFGDPTPQATAMVPYLWLLAMGIGFAWADDADAVDLWADALAARDGAGGWRPHAVAWLRALAARLRGEAVAESLVSAARAGLPGLAAFEALLWADAANVAACESHPAAADARARAEAALAALGAGPYASVLLAAAAEPGVPVATADPLAPLSEREREVVTLLLEGLSYAQIAKELYVTRSTVAFHLSNAYAKTGTSSRHELVQLVRPRGE